METIPFSAYTQKKCAEKTNEFVFTCLESLCHQIDGEYANASALYEESKSLEIHGADESAHVPIDAKARNRENWKIMRQSCRHILRNLAAECGELETVIDEIENNMGEWKVTPQQLKWWRRTVIEICWTAQSSLRQIAMNLELDRLTLLNDLARCCFEVSLCVHRLPMAASSPEVMCYSHFGQSNRY